MIDSFISSCILAGGNSDLQNSYVSLVAVLAEAAGVNVKVPVLLA